MIKLTTTKSLSQVSSEWDAIAEISEQQIASGIDHSANFVLAPAIIKKLSRADHLIDIGCGTGWLTARAAPYASQIVGIDPSKSSIAIAKEKHSHPKIKYECISVEKYSKKSEGKKFDVAISNMAASSAPNIHSFFCCNTENFEKRTEYS